jgi:hypothetical protein
MYPTELYFGPRTLAIQTKSKLGKVRKCDEVVRKNVVDEEPGPQDPAQPSVAVEVVCSR